MILLCSIQVWVKVYSDYLGGCVGQAEETEEDGEDMAGFLTGSERCVKGEVQESQGDVFHLGEGIEDKQHLEQTQAGQLKDGAQDSPVHDTALHVGCMTACVNNRKEDLQSNMSTLKLKFEVY